MTIHFVTIHQTKMLDYGIVQVKFPNDKTFEGEPRLIERHATQMAAEVAARTFSEVNHLPYVPLGKNAISALPFLKSELYLVMEINWCGSSRNIGDSTKNTTRDAAREEAAKLAEEKDLVLILPNKS